MLVGVCLLLRETVCQVMLLLLRAQDHMAAVYCTAAAESPRGELNVRLSGDSSSPAVSVS